MRQLQDLINRATCEASRIFKENLTELGQFSSDKLTAIRPKYYQPLSNEMEVSLLVKYQLNHPS